ncbi:alpha/beta hydrolase family protein [Mucilaginibacter flavidus]|uniref:alpha/beta hydrolase family protein n=1 Tax=Mucilaginibacter flavidus TaxID=2949309 RepID=UPI0020925DE6|nr:alpha/beta fold hydrolase [Mucilaginibacter flavidus]MCO5947070.1 alpha/beta fold hydrolase [Mucilaginibacter flavidus]
MKKLLICTMAFFATGQAMAQDITGSWMGTISVAGVNLHLVFNITKTVNGYSANFDSPDQKAFGIACSKATLKGDSLNIQIAAIGGGYKGLWDGKNDITGTYSQGGGSTPLNLKHITADEKAALGKDKIRSQTPKPPFGYYSQDVEYDNTDKSLHYGATFTRPNGDGKYPAVIIISGSGTQDRDGTIFGHKLYWVLADYLTKNGIAVLRVDDRGAGKSTLGDIKNATSLDFSHDVEASLNYLETRADVDKKHLGLIGHSEGGMIAPMVAARRKDVSFIVMWGASEVGGARINTEQNAYQLKKLGIDSVSVKAFADLNDDILALFALSGSVDALDAKITLVFDAWKKAQTPETHKALRTTDLNGPDVFKQYNSLYNLPWMRYFIIYDAKKDLAQVKCPVLAVNGTKDTQVDATANLGLIKEILTKNGNKNVEVRPLEGLNHLLQTATTGDVSEYEKIDETMAPSAMKIIADWIKIHTK